MMGLCVKEDLIKSTAFINEYVCLFCQIDLTRFGQATAKNMISELPICFQKVFKNGFIREPTSYFTVSNM